MNEMSLFHYSSASQQTLHKNISNLNKQCQHEAMFIAWLLIKCVSIPYCVMPSFCFCVHVTDAANSISLSHPVGENTSQIRVQGSRPYMYCWVWLNLDKFCLKPTSQMQTSDTVADSVAHSMFHPCTCPFTMDIDILEKLILKFAVGQTRLKWHQPGQFIRQYSAPSGVWVFTVCFFFLQRS